VYSTTTFAGHLANRQNLPSRSILPDGWFNMRVLLIGTGIIGSIYGCALADNGQDVVHLVRSGRAASLCDGLAVDMFDRRKGRKRHLKLRNKAGKLGKKFTFPTH
jgi:ketopantoate reductase PanE/ApbA-like protein